MFNVQRTMNNEQRIKSYKYRVILNTNSNNLISFINLKNLQNLKNLNDKNI